MRKFVVPFVIIAFWVGMMTMLVYRESGVDTAIGGRVAPVVPEETWLAVYLPGRVPAGHIRILEKGERRDDGPGILTQMQSRANLVMLGRPTEIAAVGELWRAIDGKAAAFDFSLRSNNHETRVEGEYRNGLLDATLHTAGQEISVPMRVGDDFNLAASGIGIDIAPENLEVGKEYQFDAYDPLTLSMGKSRAMVDRRETIEILGEDFEALVLEVDVGGQKSTVWIDDAGDVLRVDTAFGFTIERSNQQAALADIKPKDAADFLTASAVTPTGETPVRGARMMRIHVSGLDEGILLETDATQKQIEPGVYEIAMIEAPSGDYVALGDPEPYLDATPFEQSRDPRIVQQAQTIVGDTEGTWDKAQLIADWVYTEIVKNPVVSLPSAIEVLDTREGDCNEHTILFAALARAVGVPTRIAIGLVWSEEYEAFYYHAWPEVYAGEWIWIDPTLGQPIADATHVKILTGSITEWPKLINYIAQIQIDVDAVE